MKHADSRSSIRSSERHTDPPWNQISEVLHDDYSARQFCTRMQEEGFPMVNYGATVKNFNEPTKLLEALIKAGRIHHNEDPVLAWMMSNVIGHFDRKDNVFPVKDEHQRGNNMTDGAIALIMALARAMVEENGGSIYDTPGESPWIELDS